MLEAKVGTDLLGTHRGQRASLIGKRELLSGADQGWVVTGGLELEFLSVNYSDYYFGVRAEEANASSFERHDVNSVVQPSLVIDGLYAINDNWAISANTKYQHISNKIQDSPIIDKSYVIDGYLVLQYRF